MLRPPQAMAAAAGGRAGLIFALECVSERLRFRETVTRRVSEKRVSEKGFPRLSRKHVHRKSLSTMSTNAHK
jgi:hypothetical protein